MRSAGCHIGGEPDGRLVTERVEGQDCAVLELLEERQREIAGNGG